MKEKVVKNVNEPHLPWPHPWTSSKFFSSTAIAKSWESCAPLSLGSLKGGLPGGTRISMILILNILFTFPSEP